MSLTLHDLTIGYPGQTVATGISARLAPGELCALVGANGAGKSTLLRTVAGLLPPLAGRVEAAGVAVVLTQRVDAPGLTARDVVEAGRHPHTDWWGRLRRADRLAVRTAMELTDTTRLADRRMDTLSDGERQKVMIAKALAQETPLIVLDEPTAFLDFPSRVATMALLRNLCRRQGKAALLSTHDLDLATRACGTMWVMAGGGMAQGSPRQLADNGTLQATFGSQHVTLDAANLRFELNDI